MAQFVSIGSILSLNSLSFKPQPKVFRSYNYDEANWNLIREKLLELENMNIYDNDVDMMAETFSSKLVEIRNTCVPNKEIKILEKDKPWFDNLVKNKLRKSNRLFKAYKKLNITFTATPANGTTKTRLGSLVTSAHEKPLALQLSNGTHSQQTSNKPGTSQNSRRDLSTYSNQGNVGSTTLEQSLPTPYILNFELVGQTLMTIYSP